MKLLPFVQSNQFFLFFSNKPVQYSHQGAESVDTGVQYHLSYCTTMLYLSQASITSLQLKYIYKYRHSPHTLHPPYFDQLYRPVERYNISFVCAAVKGEKCVVVWKWCGAQAFMGSRYAAGKTEIWNDGNSFVGNKIIIWSSEVDWSDGVLSFYH